MESPLLKVVMRGIKRCTPQNRDSRISFLLTYYHVHHHLGNCRFISITKALSHCHSDFFQCYDSIIMVNFVDKIRHWLWGVREITTSEFGNEIALRLLVSKAVVGFFFLLSTINFILEQEHTTIGCEIYTAT